MTNIEDDLKIIKSQIMELQISRLYNFFLQREPLRSDINYWINELNDGKINFDDLRHKIEFSSESLNKNYQIQKTPQDDYLTKKIDDHIFYLHPNDPVLIETFTTSNQYDAGTTNLLKKVLKKGMNVINIGANIGYYTLLAARQIGPEGKVMSFEPFPETVKLLKKNIKQNNYNNVVVETMAISNKIGTATLSTGGSLLHNLISSKDIEQLTQIDVPVSTIDQYLENKKTKIDFIIMDAEGSEQFILEGMKKTLQENSNLKIVTEYNPFTLDLAGTNSESFLKTIEENDFKIFLIDENTLEIKSIEKSTLIKKIIPPQVANLFLTKDISFLKNYE